MAFERSPILKQLILNRTQAPWPTYIAVIADELAFWYSPDATANAITRDPIAVGCPAKLLIRGTNFTPLPTALIYV